MQKTLSISFCLPPASLPCEAKIILLPFFVAVVGCTRLVIGRRYDPRVLVVELDRPDVVEVAQQSEQATPKLVVPDLLFRAERACTAVHSTDAHTLFFWAGGVGMEGVGG